MSNPERRVVDITLVDGILTVSFARPEILNALDAEVLAAAGERIRSAGDDADVRVVLITGEGRAFSAGADLNSSDPDRPGRTPTLDAANALVSAISGCPKPVVAAVNGPAVGVGATIALSCDLVVAKASSYFLLAFVNIGLMPDGGATAIIPAAIGRMRASRMALLGERIGATQAFDWGLISHVVQDDQFEGEVRAIVDKLAHGPTQSYIRTKQAITAATLDSLGQAHELEHLGQVALFDTSDFDEGKNAFRDRRSAEFTGS